MTKREQFNPDNYLFGIEEEIGKAVERVKEAYHFSQQLGLGKLYVCFSGGKDSVAVYGVCKRAAEELSIDLLDMCEFNYNVTGIDNPELYWFIKREFPFVIRDMYKKSMWQLIKEKKMPPTRLVRYCCAELKEKGGLGRFCVTGVRWAESVRRANTRGALESLGSNRKENKILNADNDEDRRMLEHCIPKRKYICNPIVDWSNEVVWRFIVQDNLPYCELYDQGYSRLGCIGCPMAVGREREREFQRYPKFREQYMRTFKKMLKARQESGLPTKWQTAEDVMDWWLDDTKNETAETGETLFDTTGDK